VPCRNCGNEIEPGQRFCSHCGARVERTCLNCGELLPPGARFCPACGTVAEDAALAEGARAATETMAAGAVEIAVPGAPERTSAAEAGRLAERRLVSVLFADLVGFTTASEQRDAEETRELLARYFQVARERIERYGGTVEKFIGDAVVAVWGTPTAHEDDAERAVRAGLELVTELPALLRREAVEGEGVRLRAAVTTGEAAVTLGATDQGMVAGDIVNTAARLQALAEPGTVLVDDATARAASSSITFEALGEQELKGKAQPVAVHRAVRVMAGRGGTGRSEELEPPFVGRDVELTLLKDLFDATASEKRLRLVSVTGQAGIGKSRLLWELEKYLDGIVDLVRWHQGRSPAYGEGITFWALGEMVRRRAGIAEGEDEASTRQKLAATLEEHIPDESERRSIEPKLQALLGIGELGSVDRGELFAAWRLLFERMAERATTVLVFEDLHWADDGQLDFIEHLLTWSRRFPILIVTLARPELHERRPTWGAGQRNFTSLHLEPLPDDAMRGLLDGYVPDLPRKAVRSILARAEGVPLYAVEIVRTLVADGAVARKDGRYELVKPVDEVRLPETLLALVAARLDALPDEERNLLQVAAVLGQSFHLPGLAAVAGSDSAQLEPLLAELTRKELLRLETDPRSPERGQYQFVQAMTREVAYGTLSKRDRKTHHVAAARYFESLGDDELAGALARHYVEAYRAAPEGPEAETLMAQARVALRAAAERAAALHAQDQALAFVELAISISRDPAEQAMLRERGASLALGAARPERAYQLAREAIDLYRAATDAASQARVSARLGGFYINEGLVLEAIAFMSEALEELEGQAGEEDLATLVDQLARGLYIDRQVDRAMPLVARALDAAERHGLEEVAVDALITRGSVLMDDRNIEGRALLYGAAELSRQSGSGNLLRALNNLASYLPFEGPLTMRGLMEPAVEEAKRQGERGALHYFGAWAALIRFDLGDVEAAESVLAEFEDDDVSPKPVFHMSLLRAVIAAVRDDDEAAQRHSAEAKRQLAQISDWQYPPVDQLTRGLIAFVQGRFEDVRSEVRKVTAMPEALGRAAYLGGLASLWLGNPEDTREGIVRIERMSVRGPLIDAYLAVLRGGIAAIDGEVSEARLEFREAFRLLRETGAAVELVYAQLTCVRLLGTSEPEARRAADEARQTIERLRADGLRRLLDQAVVSAGATAGRAPGTRDAQAVSSVGEATSRST
jgi:class 3 adenylate cyclase/tetratricopeptide (TPR) repeat protein